MSAQPVEGQKILILPVHHELTDDDQRHIVTVLDKSCNLVGVEFR